MCSLLRRYLYLIDAFAMHNRSGRKEELVINPEDQLQDQSPAYEWLEALSEEELQAISGGISISMPPRVSQRAFSESDLTRLARQHPGGDKSWTGITCQPHCKQPVQ
jgi:bacteriocin-like protein